MVYTDSHLKLLPKIHIKHIQIVPAHCYAVHWQTHGHSQRVMAQRSKYVLRHILRKDPTISYVELSILQILVMNLGRVCVAGILKRISYEIQVSYVCK